jgi:GNAT superfamily N-acetyltransferase
MTIAILPSGLEIKIRPYTTTDEAYVMSSMKRRLASLREYQGMVHWALMDWLNRKCDALIKNCETRIACNPADNDQILGWACIERDINCCHFVAVLQPFRRQGIARTLLAGLREPIRCSHWTSQCEGIQRNARLYYEPSLSILPAGVRGIRPMKTDVEVVL